MDTRYENKSFKEGELPSFIKNTVFYNCKFAGKLPDFALCELHNCDISHCKISELVECSLFSTNMDSCDFSEADVRFSKTNAGSPCSAHNCEWQGIAAIMDCNFFGGLVTDEKSAELFLIMATIPQSPVRKKIIAGFSSELLSETKRRLTKEWRGRKTKLVGKADVKLVT